MHPALENGSEGEWGRAKRKGKGGGQRGSEKGGGNGVREQSSKHPAQPNRPPHSSIPPNAAPAKHEREGEGFASDENGEEEEGGGDGVEGELEG